MPFPVHLTVPSRSASRKVNTSTDESLSGVVSDDGIQNPLSHANTRLEHRQQASPSIVNSSTRAVPSSTGTTYDSSIPGSSRKGKFRLDSRNVRAYHPYRVQTSVASDEVGSAVRKRSVLKPQREAESSVAPMASTQPEPAVVGANPTSPALAVTPSRPTSPVTVTDFSAALPLQGQPSRQAAPQLPRYIPRADTRFHPRTMALAAQVELPGVRTEDLSITLSTCAWNGVRQIVVRGKVWERWMTLGEEKEQEIGSAIDDGCTIIRERKYGEFIRAMAVPPGTTVEDVKAHLLDGLLFLRIACKCRVDESDRRLQEIKVTKV